MRESKFGMALVLESSELSGGYVLGFRWQFHQCITRSFYARRSQKHKNAQLSQQYLFTLLGYARVKAVRRTLMKLTVDIKQPRYILLTYVETYTVKKVSSFQANFDPRYRVGQNLTYFCPKST
jgi:hypothetical protein